MLHRRSILEFSLVFAVVAPLAGVTAASPSAAVRGRYGQIVKLAPDSEEELTPAQTKAVIYGNAKVLSVPGGPASATLHL